MEVPTEPLQDEAQKSLDAANKLSTPPSMRKIKLKPPSKNAPTVADAIEMDGVSFGYEPHQPILRNLSLTIPMGAFYFLTGPSGTGKSSLMRLLYLAHQADQGKISLFGRDITSLSRNEKTVMRRRIGVVFQDFCLIEELTAFENVALALRVTSEDRQIQHNVGDLMIWAGLKDQQDRPVSSLSGGQKQRVAIARAIICRPLLLLADEPTGSVDDSIAVRLLYLFEELHRAGTTVLLATHNRALVQRFPHPEIRLEDGELIEMESEHSLTASRSGRSIGG